MASSAHRSAAKGRCPCIAAGPSSPGAPGQGQLRAQGPGSLSLTCKAARPSCTGSSSYILANFIHVPSLGPVKTNSRQLHVGSVCTAFLHKATSAGQHRVPEHAASVPIPRGFYEKWHEERREDWVVAWNGGKETKSDFCLIMR